MKSNMSSYKPFASALLDFLTPRGLDEDEDETPLLPEEEEPVLLVDEVSPRGVVVLPKETP